MPSGGHRDVHLNTEALPEAKFCTDLGGSGFHHSETVSAQISPPLHCHSVQLFTDSWLELQEQQKPLSIFLCHLYCLSPKSHMIPQR